MRAPPPPKATGTLTISFGLGWSITCAVFGGTEETAVKRKEFVRTEGVDEATGEVTTVYAPAGRVAINKETEQVVAYDELVRLVDTDYGPVEVTTEEWTALTEAAPGTADIVCFLPLAHMASGHFVPEAMHQLKPKKAGSGKNKVETSGKAFDLLMATMRKRGVFAIVKATMRRGTSPRYGALMPNERLYLLHFDNEIREDLERTPNQITEEQLERAAKLIDEATLRHPPELIDEASERIREFASLKAQGDDIPEVREIEAKTETVDDLDAMLAQMGA